jgi:hypothetical protein
MPHQHTNDRCDADITPIAYDPQDWRATHCGRPEGHPALGGHKSYAALAAKRKTSTLEERMDDFQWQVVGHIDLDSETGRELMEV